jgi:predicted GH43/DUF377 family glycosyl hydrolase
MSCNSNNISDTTTQKGTLNLSINKTNIPNDVSKLKIYLTRDGFENIEEEAEITDSTTNYLEIQISAVVIGTWKLIVEAVDANETIIFNGEKNIEVTANEVSPIHITLTPTDNGTGDLFIYIDWFNYDKWFDHPTNPIITKHNNSEDQYGIWEPTVIYDDGKFKMWYFGLAANAYGSIFYAHSDDGINWTKYSNQPVISEGNSGDWDGRRVQPGAVIKIGAEYFLYYSGFNDPDGKWGIGLARSDDGIYWTKYSQPIIEGGDIWDYHIMPASIIELNDKYYLYYSGNMFLGDDYRIGLAVSNDGIIWEKYDYPIFNASMEWENNSVRDASVLNEDGNLIMLYTNGQAPDAFGFAYSTDGINWIKRTDKPFFDYTDSINDYVTIAHPYFIKYQNEYRIYYTGFYADDDAELCLARLLP